MTPHLVIVTGPSHVGKSTIAQLVLQRLDRPAAYVAIDEIVARLDMADLDPWQHGLASAYDAAVAETSAFLANGFVVVLESTFTYIPAPPDAPQRHDEQLARLAEAARQAGAGCVVIRLVAAAEELVRRQRATGRLTAEIVEGTSGQHATALGIDCPVVEVDAGARPPDEVAGEVDAALGRFLR